MLPELMPAAVYIGDGRIAVQDLPVPDPGPDEVLVEVAQCGICGSDMHLVLEGYARPGTVLGHEWAGTVVATGAAVRGGRSVPGWCRTRPPDVGNAGPVGRAVRRCARNVPPLTTCRSGGVLPLCHGAGRTAPAPTRFALHSCRRPDRTHGHRPAHRQSLPGHAGRPCPRHRRRAGRAAHRRRPSRPRCDRHHGLRARPPSAGPGQRRGSGHRHGPGPVPTFPPSVDRSTAPTTWPSNARDTPVRRRPPSTNWISPAPSSWWGPGGTVPGSTTTG